MAKQRIVAHYMHEIEADAARKVMPNGQATDALMVGDIDESDLPSLRAAGVIVQHVDQPQRPPLVEQTRSPRTKGASPGGPRPAPPADKLELARPRYYALTLAGPLLEDWRKELQARGARLVDSLPGFAMKVRLDAAGVAAVGALPFVSSLRLLDSETSRPTDQEMDGLGEFEKTGVRAMIPFDVLLVEDENAGYVRRWLTDRFVPIAAAGGNKIRIHLEENSPFQDEIGDLPEVDRIEPYIVPELHNDKARVLLGLESPNPGVILIQEGDGQIVGVADTGLDETHPDIPAGRRVGVVALGRPGNASDPHGHGTHVAGSILGDGASSGGAVRGTAPRARLFFQSLLDMNGKLGGLPFRLQDLFAEAYNRGARIHNNSWGSATGSTYRVNSNEVDDFVQEHKDMLIVISAGNEGTAADPLPGRGRRRSQPGFVDWLSIGSPATAKNALCVGASQNDRATGGYATLTYGTNWPGEFADVPIRDEPVSGNPQSMAAFSSRGPCDDYRIKPDVVAPGTDILSCRSNLAPLRNFWGGAPNPAYAYMGGTSMAAPLVSGCAALVREYYVKTRGVASPSAALVKATLVNGARRLTGPAAIADHASVPNYHQGFGAVDMSRTIPNNSAPAMVLEYFDNWQDPGSHFGATGQRRRFQLTLAPGMPLRVCLAYTDPPGRALVNNLDLLLQDPTSAKWIGNEQLPHGLNIPDPTNNVETVTLANPPAGNYLIQISASNILRPPQDFALVVTGNITNFARIS